MPSPAKKRASRKPSPARQLLDKVSKPFKKSSTNKPSSGDVQPGTSDVSTSTILEAEPSRTRDKDLWRRALQKLKEEKPDVFDHVQSLAAAGGKPLDSARLISIYKDNIRDINMRALAQRYGRRRRLIQWGRYLQAFNATSIRAGRFEPTGGATMGIGVFTTVLDIALSKVELDDSLANDLDDVCSKIDRCADKEAKLLHKSQTCPQSLINKADEYLVAVYALVLEYSTVSREYLELNPAVAMARVVELRPELKRIKADLDTKFKICEDSFDKIKSDNEFFKANQEILNWIFKDDCITDHFKRRKATRIADQYERSGQWLLESDEFKGWDLDDGLQVLWLRGTAGTGKSTLTAGGTSEVTSAENAENALLQQLCEIKGEDAIIEPVANLYGKLSRDRRAGAQLAKQERRNLLGEIFQSCRETRIVIDALDECAEWWDLLRTLKEAASSHAGNLKLFLTSRLNVDVGEYFPQCVTVMLDVDLTRDDMEYFVNEEVFGHEDRARLLNGEYPEIEKDLAKVLLEKSQGMFLWVKLTVSLFFPNKRYTTADWREVKERIRRLQASPAGADDQLCAVYQEIFDTNAPHERSRLLAQQALQMVLGAFEQISWDQLRDALAVTDPSAAGYCHDDIDRTLTVNELRQITQNLLVTGPRHDETNSDVLQFAHMSVVDFLLKSNDCYSQLNCHKEIFRRCLFFVKHAAKQLHTYRSRLDHSWAFFDWQAYEDVTLMAPDESKTGDLGTDDLNTAKIDTSILQLRLSDTGVIEAEPDVEDSEIQQKGSWPNAMYVTWRAYAEQRRLFTPYAYMFWAKHCAAVLILSEEKDGPMYQDTNGLLDYIAVDLFGDEKWLEPLRLWLHTRELLLCREPRHVSAGAMGWFISASYGVAQLAEKLVRQDRYNNPKSANSRDLAEAVKPRYPVSTCIDRNCWPI
ncbi:uncharacterized protein AB675_7800 [Cyphellophora attinorum]|uniref:Nephrocystin 3-like N-terminal domain-containing protein n=1 Tax=Cyphellophora attinorum TaxID=1664694 RepID=A0A0N1HQZ4_9EURO|nr:uncharacterized protein AB675_7800 [Phialophora attinorum]KPI40527.1 hypothetical protein AB675_7800 [Phialophora attinorum]